MLGGDASVVARRLLGCELHRELDGVVLRGRITEVEAYDQNDAASHSYRGKTPRTEVMFGPSGYLYVYFTYGMHYCCNVVTGPEGVGSAVLIRSVEPLEGREKMRERRGNRSDTELTNGPAKLCQAFGIDAYLNGHNLKDSPLRLIVKPAVNDQDIAITPRIGISKAVDAPLRFILK